MREGLLKAVARSKDAIRWRPSPPGTRSYERVKLASLRTEQGCYERGETGMVTRNKKVLATSRIDRPNSSRFFGNARALAGNRTPAIEEGGRGLGCRSLSEEASPFSAEDEIGEDELKQKNNGHVKSAAGT